MKSDVVILTAEMVAMAVTLAPHMNIIEQRLAAPAPLSPMARQLLALAALVPGGLALPPRPAPTKYNLDLAARYQEERRAKKAAAFAKRNGAP